MLKENIQRITLEIVKTKFKKEISSNHDLPLLGKKNKFEARDLLYLYFFIKQEFGIEIDSKYILDGSFSTINNIVKIIYKTLYVKKTTVVE